MIVGFGKTKETVQQFFHRRFVASVLRTFGKGILVLGERCSYGPVKLKTELTVI